MSVTFKDLEKIKPLARKLSRVVLRLVPLVRLVARVGFVRRWMAKTTGGRMGAINACQKRGEHDKAAALAIDALKAYRHGTGGVMGAMSDGTWSWWLFMGCAARSLEHCGDPRKTDEVVALAEDGPEPFEGYDVAQAFLGLSRCRYAEGDHDKALALARRATEADPTWAEPEVLLAWYALALGGGAALEHLGRALERDPRVLFRIAKDPLFRRNPHILARLKALAREIAVIEGGGPDAEDSETAEV